MKRKRQRMGEVSSLRCCKNLAVQTHTGATKPSELS
jgi:hypothetical protein